MRYMKYFTGLAMTAGMLAAGAPSASAQGWRYSNPVQGPDGNSYYRQGNPNGHVYGYNNGNGYGNRFDQMEELQEHVAHDHAKLDEAIRCRNEVEAARQAADLARGQRALRDMQYDQSASYNDHPVYNRRWSGWSFRLR
jgi:hypothetical protein